MASTAPLLRHSREGWNSGCRAYRLWLWIPAFAGMAKTWMVAAGLFFLSASVTGPAVAQIPSARWSEQTPHGRFIAAIELRQSMFRYLDAQWGRAARRALNQQFPNREADVDNAVKDELDRRAALYVWHANGLLAAQSSHTDFARLAEIAGTQAGQRFLADPQNYDFVSRCHWNHSIGDGETCDEMYTNTNFSALVDISSGETFMSLSMQALTWALASYIAERPENELEGAVEMIAGRLDPPTRWMDLEEEEKGIR